MRQNYLLSKVIDGGLVVFSVTVYGFEQKTC